MDKILVVDDDSCSLKNVAYFLRTQGYEVDEASNGNEAAQLLDEGGFDLVLSDVIMPGINGLSLLERTRSSNPEIPFVIMSAFPNIEVDQIINRGAADFIAKPLEFLETKSLVVLSHNPDICRFTSQIILCCYSEMRCFVISPRLGYIITVLAVLVTLACRFFLSYLTEAVGSLLFILPILFSALALRGGQTR